MNKTFLIALIAAVALTGVQSNGVIIPAVESLQSKISSIIATSTYKPAVESSAVSSASKAAASIRSVVSEHLKASSSSAAAQTTAATTSDETSTADAVAETNNEVVSSASRVFENYSLLVQFTVIATILVGSLFAVVA